MVKTLLVDMEFECLAEDFEGITVNTAAAREHVGEIERMIRVVKERCRCVLGDLRRSGYKYFHKWIVVHCAYYVTMMITALPSPKDFSRVYSPREFVLGKKLDLKKDCRVPFGSYVEASTDAVITNDMSDRTHACIALGPSGNLQGSIKCFDLLTGQVVRRRSFTPMPLAANVLKLVNRWG